jgi:predicted GNAT family N-acyltransferase
MDDSSFMHGVSEVSNNTPVSYNPMQQEENVLSKRISRTMKAVEPIVYEFTKDKGYLHQYYLLREQVYTQVWELKGFIAQEDDFDKRGMILIARRGNQVVGGLRLNFRDERNNKMLPGESGDFEFYKALPDMNLEYKKIVECTRLAVLAEFRKEAVAHELIQLCLKKSAAMNGNYLFFISPSSQTRAHCRSVRKIGMNYRTFDFKMPQREEYEGINMDLSYVDLNNQLHESTTYSQLEVQL